LIQFDNVSSSFAKAYAPRRWHICVLTVKMSFLMQAITAFKKEGWQSG
jgi:hypothetical protein